jgi:calreticulin
MYPLALISGVIDLLLFKLAFVLRVTYLCNPCTAIGFELWQVKSGTLFDDIIVTDSVEEAKAFAEETFSVKSKAEAAMQKKLDEEAAAKAAEESKKKDEEEEDWEEEEEEEKEKADL